MPNKAKRKYGFKWDCTVFLVRTASLDPSRVQSLQQLRQHRWNKQEKAIRLHKVQNHLILRYLFYLSQRLHSHGQHSLLKVRRQRKRLPPQVELILRTCLLRLFLRSVPQTLPSFTPHKSITINSPSKTLHVSSLKKEICREKTLRSIF